MRPVLAALLAGTGVFALMARRPRSPRQNPRWGRVKHLGEAERAHEPSADRYPHRTATPEGTGVRGVSADEKHQRAERIYWFVSSLGGLVAAGAAFAAAWFASDALDASRQAVNEARMQVGAMQRQIEEGRVMQRAFITASDYKITKLEDGANQKACWRFDPVISNTGETPTRNMEYTKEVVAMVLPFPGEQGSAHALTIAPTDPEDRFQQYRGWSRALLGPKQSLPSIGGVGRVCLGHENSANMWTPERIYVRGVVHYGDVFPGSPEHITKYCFWIQAVENKDVYEPRVVLCSHWNCADDECERDKEAYDAEVARNFAKTGQTLQPPREFFPQ